MAEGDNSHRRFSWNTGLVSFGGKDYPIAAGDTQLLAPVGVKTAAGGANPDGWLIIAKRYVVFWEKGTIQNVFQTVLESDYNRAIKARVIIAELTVPSGDDFVEGNDVQLEIKADGQASKLTAPSPVWQGSAAAPAYSFVGDPNTGMYSSTADQVHFSAGGTERLQVSSAGIEVWGKVYGQQGNAVGPTYSFIAGTTMGMYYKSADHLGFSAGGAERLDVSSTGITVTGGVAATGAISGTTITGSGAISGTTITGSGAISGTTITGSGAISGTTITGSGSIVGLIITASTSNNCFRGGAGSLAYPAYTFTGDLDTGMYRDAVDTLALVTGGQAVNIKTAIQTSPSAHYMGIYPNNEGDANASDGSDGRPWINFGTYPTTSTGWNYKHFNAMVAYYFQAGDGTTTFPGFAFKDDPNTGFYRIASGHTGYTDDNTHRIDFGGHPRDTVYNNSGTPTTITENYEFGVSGSMFVSAYVYAESFRPEEDLENDIGTSTRRFRNIYVEVPSVGSGTLIKVTSAGKLVKDSSSIRYKTNVKPLALDTSKLSKLRPVTFDYTYDNASNIGLIAEEVSEVLPELVEYNTDGQPESVRFNGLTVMLLEKVKELENEIQKLKEKN